VSALVATGIEAKSQLWDTAGDEPLPVDVASIGIGLDGVCMLFCDDGYRQAMVGTITFYDATGMRLHTTYVATAPEQGKSLFLEHMDQEIERVKKRSKERDRTTTRPNWIGSKPLPDSMQPTRTPGE